MGVMEMYHGTFPWDSIEIIVEMNGCVMGFQRDSNGLFNGFTIELEHGILIGLLLAVKWDFSMVFC
jgi:hypothetical protein